jgi:hypothetical protein
MLKVDLHTHTADDPEDLIPYNTAELIDRAAALGYDALAVTLHNRQLDLRPWVDFARDRGVVLIPGLERTIGGKHVLLLNFPAVAEDVVTFDDVRALRRHADGLVVAPHPFYPGTTCLCRSMDRHADLFDAVEFSGFHTRGSGAFNRAAVRWAAGRGLPVVGNGDVHRLSQLGRTFSLVDAEPTPGSICRAIREGRVELCTEPLSVAEAGTCMSSLIVASWKKSWRGEPGRAAGEPLRA